MARRAKQERKTQSMITIHEPHSQRSRPVDVSGLQYPVLIIAIPHRGPADILPAADQHELIMLAQSIATTDEDAPMKYIDGSEILDSADILRWLAYDMHRTYIVDARDLRNDLLGLDSRGIPAHGWPGIEVLRLKMEAALCEVASKKEIHESDCDPMNDPSWGVS